MTVYFQRHQPVVRHLGIVGERRMIDPDMALMDAILAQSNPVPESFHEEPARSKPPHYSPPADRKGQLLALAGIGLSALIAAAAFLVFFVYALGGFS